MMLLHDVTLVWCVLALVCLWADYRDERRERTVEREADRRLLSAHLWDAANPAPSDQIRIVK